MSDIKEKISAFYDGELNLSSKEIDELIIFINENPSLSEQISMMALTSAMNESEDSNLTSINAKKKDSNISYKNFWLSNSITAAATILLTLTVVTNFDFSRMNVSTDSSNKISSAINSKEAKMIAQRSEEQLTDYIMKIVNEPGFMAGNEMVDLRNVGYQYNPTNGSNYFKDKENFQLRIEKKDFGLNKIKYWKHGNKMIYLVPLSDGRVLTLYGNISLNSAISIAQSLNK
ncbi:MAG: hypothetical protein CMC61_04185 [Flavobacteriaceae bacterium]|nr:hypothetical protein [Flavobacteriaceae bacterium]